MTPPDRIPEEWDEQHDAQEYQASELLSRLAIWAAFVSLLVIVGVWWWLQ